MQYKINLNFGPSTPFMQIISDLGGQVPNDAESGYDWADQTTDFLRAPSQMPAVDEKALQTPVGHRAVNDVLHMAIALLSGQYAPVRNYLEHMRYAFVIGFPRSGGSYLTKELLRATGLDHQRVPEALAHDGFPDLGDAWYRGDPGRPYYHLQQSIFQMAEFLVVSNLYFQIRGKSFEHRRWLAPKKMHKAAYWGASLKLLLGQGRADYLITARHPLPSAISVADKSGGLPGNGLFPAAAPRSAIERWIVDDLLRLGHRLDDVAKMHYFEAVIVAWTNFYARVATSGLFLGDSDGVRVVPYGKESVEGVARDYRMRIGLADGDPEPFFVHDKAAAHGGWFDRGDAAVAAVSAQWQALGLPFPKLDKE